MIISYGPFSIIEYMTLMAKSSDKLIDIIFLYCVRLDTLWYNNHTSFSIINNKHLKNMILYFTESA